MLKAYQDLHNDASKTCCPLTFAHRVFAIRVLESKGRVSTARSLHVHPESRPLGRIVATVTSSVTYAIEQRTSGSYMVLRLADPAQLRRGRPCESRAGFGNRQN